MFFIKINQSHSTARPFPLPHGFCSSTLLLAAVLSSSFCKAQEAVNIQQQIEDKTTPLVQFANLQVIQDINLVFEREYQLSAAPIVDSIERISEQDGQRHIEVSYTFHNPYDDWQQGYYVAPFNQSVVITSIQIISTTDSQSYQNKTQYPTRKLVQRIIDIAPHDSITVILHYQESTDNVKKSAWALHESAAFTAPSSQRMRF